MPHIMTSERDANVSLMKAAKGDKRRCCAPPLAFKKSQDDKGAQRLCFGYGIKTSSAVNGSGKILKLGFKGRLLPKRLRRFDPSKFQSKGFFEVFSGLKEGDLVLFRTSKRFMPRVQRFACSTSFDHVGIVVLCDDCDDECCSPELKQVRKEAGIPSYHTLEADSGGVQVYRFTPACLRSYSGTVFVRSLDLSRLTSAQISAARSALRSFG